MKFITILTTSACITFTGTAIGITQTNDSINVKTTVQKTPKATAGWSMKAGKWYYSVSYGTKLKGLQKIRSNTFYFNDSGVMQNGWVWCGPGTYRYFNGSGYMQKGWLKEGRCV